MRHFGSRVLSEATRMGNMVNELIALSRLQGAERLPDLDLVDVDELVGEAVARAQVEGMLSLSLRGLGDNGTRAIAANGGMGGDLGVRVIRYGVAQSGSLGGGAR